MHLSPKGRGVVGCGIEACWKEGGPHPRTLVFVAEKQPELWVGASYREFWLTDETLTWVDETQKCKGCVKVFEKERQEVERAVKTINSEDDVFRVPFTPYVDESHDGRPKQPLLLKKVLFWWQLGPSREIVAAGGEKAHLTSDRELYETLTEAMPFLHVTSDRDLYKKLTEDAIPSLHSSMQTARSVIDKLKIAVQKLTLEDNVCRYTLFPSVDDFGKKRTLTNLKQMKEWQSDVRAECTRNKLCTQIERGASASRGQFEGECMKSNVIDMLEGLKRKEKALGSLSTLPPVALYALLREWRLAPPPAQPQASAAQEA